MKAQNLNTRNAGMLLGAVLVLLASAAVTLPGCGGQSTDNDTLVDEDGTITGDDVLESDEGQTGVDARADISTGEDLLTPDGAGTDTTGEDTAEKDTAVAGIECQEQATTPVIKVTVYNDVNASSKTDFVQSLTAVDMPWAGVPVSMVAPSEGSGLTCDWGWYYFGPDGPDQFTDGVRVLKIDAPECNITSHNMARRTPVALAEGKWKMLVIGDSIPRQGTETGMFFFDNVAGYLYGFGDITVTNVAFIGSTSVGWLPATLNYKNKVQPNLADSDVVFISLGGNDIMHYLYNNQNKPLDQLMEGITQTIADVENNLTEIFTAIRTEKPDADIVWLVYPNYATSDNWRETTGTYAELVAQYFEEQMYGILAWAAGIDGLILVDLFSRMDKEELDASLFDELHYNAYGHRILGDELFKVLNGVIVTGGSPTVGADRRIGFNCDN